MIKKLDKRTVERISKALADPYRLKMIEAVKKQADWMQCVAVVEMFDLAQSTVSHHLRQLVEADLLIAEKNGRNAKYLINYDTFTSYINYLSAYQE